jgi:hypothetical protein
MSTFILVHGAWQGGWCWYKVTPLDLSEPNFGRAPRVYIETLRDSAVTLRAQRRMLATMACATVISLNTGHSPFFSAPQELAGRLVLTEIRT